MTPIVLNLSDEEIDRVKERAEQSGYGSIEAYLRGLVDADIADEPDEDAASLQADFKEAFKDALKGKFYTEEEFWKAMKEDD